jgi:hypothetical protein
MSVTHAQVIGLGSLRRLPAVAARASDAPLCAGVARAASPGMLHMGVRVVSRARDRSALLATVDVIADLTLVRRSLTRG